MASARNAVPIEILSDDDSDIDGGDVIALPSPPVHLRRHTNKERPIAVDLSDDDQDSDGEDDEDELDEAAQAQAEYRRSLMMEPNPVHRVKRKRSDESTTSALSSSSTAPAPAKKARSDPQVQHNGAGPAQPPIVPTAGPSRHQQNRPQSAEDYVAQIMEIIPDICPAYAMREVLTAAGPDNHGVANVVAKALDEGYPKAADTQKKAKEVRAEPGQEEGYRGRVFRSIKRRGHTYSFNSVQALEQAYPSIPVNYIRTVLSLEAGMFGPAYLRLRLAEQADPKPYKPLARGRLPGKSKGKESHVHFADDVFGGGFGGADVVNDGGRAEFELEKNWILTHVAELIASEDAKEARRLADELEIENGNGLECGCCFGDYVWVNMFQCQEGHLFCKECSTKHAETKLGDQEHTILCMDTSGCQALFAEAELSRLLSAKSLELYHRLKLAKELEQAAIEGLENCPFCPWAVVIDNPHEKLFRCENDPCRKVSCRACKKAEHLPKSCKEAEVERKAGGRHAVEDAMSEALIRKCPNCAKPYIKDSGCNKILCLKCKTLSCYICQKAVKDYSHFDSAGCNGIPRGPDAPRSCPLWDRQEAQHDNDKVVAARDAAIQAQRDAAAREGVDINEDDLRVEAPPQPPPGQPYNPYYPPGAGLLQIPAADFALNLPPNRFLPPRLDPQRFLGLDINERARQIAEDAMNRYHNLQAQDPAVLARPQLNPGENLVLEDMLHARAQFEVRVGLDGARVRGEGAGRMREPERLMREALDIVGRDHPEQLDFLQRRFEAQRAAGNDRPGGVPPRPAPPAAEPQHLRAQLRAQQQAQEQVEHRQRVQAARAARLAVAAQRLEARARR